MVCPHCLIDVDKTGRHHFACPEFVTEAHVSWSGIDPKIMEELDLDDIAKKVADKVQEAFSKALKDSVEEWRERN